MSPDNSKNLARDLESDGFIARFGGVFEHSPWIAEAALAENPGLLHADVGTLHAAMAAVLRAAGPERQLVVLRAHPDLAGKLALAGELTADSSAEQAGAGLDRCTPEEFARFQELNDRYQAKFGFPFIIAVRGLDRHDILRAFEKRVGNTPEQEFQTALGQVERIALLRLYQITGQPQHALGQTLMDRLEEFASLTPCRACS
jgi:2-oxo-4-hydroxy-4-carboxy-5-ureidoimidazoline decarboxylase